MERRPITKCAAAPCAGLVLVLALTGCSASRTQNVSTSSSAKHGRTASKKPAAPPKKPAQMLGAAPSEPATMEDFFKLAREVGWNRVPAPALGMVAPADMPEFRETVERSRSCFGESRGEVTVEIALDEEGNASARPVDATVPEPVARCAASTFSGGRYTPPNTPVDGGVSAQHFSVTIRYGVASPPDFMD